MSASSRDARKLAVCGGKPGGPDKYYLKETCVLKGRGRAGGPSRDKTATYIAFVTRDLVRVRAARARLPKGTSHRPPMPAQDQLVLQIFLDRARDSGDAPVQARIASACDVFNRRKVNARRQIRCDPLLELLVMNGAIMYYSTLLKNCI